MRVIKFSKFKLIFSLPKLLAFTFWILIPNISVSEDIGLKAEEMVLIPAADLSMGSDAEFSMENERHAYKVKLKSFKLDQHPVTNKQFAKLIKSTGYITTAERKPDWEELIKQDPAGTEKAAEELLQAGSLVFTPLKQAVDTSTEHIGFRCTI